MRLIKQLLVALVIASLLEGWWSCDSCLENERNALLQLKASFNYPEGMSPFSGGLLTDDCCKWENIHCSSTTGRVSKLSIRSDYWGLEWCFNASLFLPFQELTSLSLRINRIIDCVENEGFERLERLSKLEFLDLEGTLFNNKSIVSSIGHLSSLKSLNLADNGLESVTDIQGLSGLENLEFLDLSYNNFSDSIIPFLRIFPSLKSLNLTDNKLESGIQGLSGLENLEFLDLSFNNFDKSIIPLLSVFSSLKSLTLTQNRLENITDFQGLSKLSNLEFLDLSFNDIGNSILSSIGDLSSLKELHLDGCGLRGTFDIQKLDALGNLKVLSLRGNRITKVVDSRDVKIIRNLSSLFLDDNYGYGRSSIQLELLGAYPFPKTLSLMRSSFKGRIFAQEMGNFSSVEELSLDYSSLDEESFKSLRALPSLKFLSMQRVNADLPSQGLPNFKNLEHLDLRSSALHNNFLKDIEKMPSLKILLLSDCQLNGTIPAAKGKIPTEIGNLGKIQVLNLSHNSLTGLIPQSFSNLKQIESLDLSYNNLNGSIPQLTQLNFLAVFSVAHNNLSGKTPEMVAQFATFENSSYEGNPFLCGPPLSKSCFSSTLMPRVSEEDKKDHKKDGGFMDMEAFYVSFLTSYAIVLLTIAAVLYVNPYWRRAWFYMIELSLTNLGYFLVDNIPFLFRCY